MAESEVDANSGVEALLGFEFQRNCSLLVLLDNYSEFEKKDYFLSIEHFDDFLFCFKNLGSNEVEHIKSYQAKKLTDPKWTISALSNPLGKMLDVGQAILKDTILKSSDFKIESIFISNCTIELKSDNINKDIPSEKAKYITTTVKENNTYVSFLELDDLLKTKIKNCVSNDNKLYGDAEFDVLAYEWIDLPKTAKNQLAVLDSRMRDNFKDIPDSKAAVQVLLSLFKSIELVYNQKNKISLLDKSKILEGKEIKKAVKTIDLEQRAFKFWRDSAREFCPKLQISKSVSNKAEEHIGIAFELFKDKTQVEYKKIFDFVKNGTFDNYTYTDEDCISSFIDAYYGSPIKSNSLSHVNIVFAIVCAYVQTRDIKQ
ncbi:hypothetical protein CJF42_16260 [Pseudoalteromonas sp. NBT06-2]|uniref:hypothetical protein n=1 Tax=Pseudoalteromonas sp. NBT06-2 TaxID=2025950 RepID=UPI000BA67A30|nr:hypothetical protein [Pseudoalteromonas sp. NBT06-2]PAJ73344.1 hypothetical protein CJF42_16260 [Pseudoalteromonas sp. NBT06-2]